MCAVAVRELVACVASCGAKAAHIAQAFRGQGDLFRLLVQEKAQVERNKRFVSDFKTLADVLVQETIRRDVAKKFPALLENIRGEEQNSFCNALGESIRVELTDSPQETAALLARVLDGRDQVADVIARAVHHPHVDAETVDSDALLDARHVGIWIDPIDSTAEYIAGAYDEREEYGIKPYGLRCVCVLIGVYDLRTGKPLIGLLNQPFYHKDPLTGSWESRSYWAVSMGADIAVSPSLQPREQEREHKIAVLSSSETDALRAIVATRYRVVNAAGSGYKSLLVACGKADLYVLSLGTTYFWDTCGPHSILASQGGGILKFDQTITASDIATAEDVRSKEIQYIATDDKNTGIKAFQNSGGIIAYRNPEDVLELIALLRENNYVHS